MTPVTKKWLLWGGLGGGALLLVILYLRNRAANAAAASGSGSQTLPDYGGITFGVPTANTASNYVSPPAGSTSPPPPPPTSPGGGGSGGNLGAGPVGTTASPIVPIHGFRTKFGTWTQAF